MKNKWPKIGLIFLVWFIPLIIKSQTQTINPGKPVLGQPIPLEFTPNPESPALASINLILYRQLLNSPDTLAMHAEQSRWTTTTTINDTSVTYLLFHLEGLDEQGKPFYYDNKGSLFEIFLHNMAGVPLRGAYMSQALALSGYGNLMNENLPDAIQAIEQELKLYPDHFQARLLKYTLLMQEGGLSNETSYLMSEDIKNTLRQEKESVSALNFALQAYQMIEDEQEIRKIQEKLIRKEPQGQQAAVSAFNEVMNLDNAEEQAYALETFIQKYPDSRLHEIALSQLASTIIELDDSTAIINAGDRLLIQAKTMAGASGLSALAGVLAEKKWQLNRAQNYIDQALEIINTINPKEHPPEISDAEWQERILYTKARYKDIKGWIYYQKDDLQQALILLEEASQDAMEPGILYHLAETQNALGEQEQAISNYARVTAYGGGMAEMARGKLNQIWQTTGRDSAQLKTLLNQEENLIQNAYIQKIVQRRQVKPAPDFLLKRLTGGSTKLSESRGEKVLLCFWSTWSDASAQMMDALMEIMYRREDMEIIAVAVDQNAADISKYVRDNRIPFQVLLIDGQVEQAYNLRGVPVLFVIDPAGRIHFQHKGYRPDLIEILDIELDNLN